MKRMLFCLIGILNLCCNLYTQEYQLAEVEDMLDVNGTIRAKEILVETTGADFVFADDYQLRPLSEVKAFITENKHLPEIQSAQEMQENGVSVSELQTKLLQKIEELTLYLIQQENRIKELEGQLK